MQIYLDRVPIYSKVNQYVTVTFDKSIFKVLFNEIEIFSETAYLGECYNIDLQGKKYPIIVKETLPDRYGMRIAYTLGFVQSYKLISTPEDFIGLCKDHEIDITANPETCHATRNYMCLYKEGTYGLVFSRKVNQRKGYKNYKPIYAWISDKISKEELQNLLAIYRSYRKISASDAYFNYL